MIINIKGTGIELTEALKSYAEEKVQGLTKFFDNIRQADIDIGMRTHHHQKGKIYYAEVNLHVPGELVRVVKESEDLYKAIDKVKDHLKVDLEKRKEKMRGRDKKMLRGTKEYQG
jgi:putative sigma-54 modulation protein